jgi:hypothetical protein
MHRIVITLAIVAALALIHFSYVDFRFRHRDGIRWYWLLSPAPPLMWVSRGAIIAAFIAALSVAYFGTSITMAVILGGLVLLHIVSLVLVEILEPR